MKKKVVDILNELEAEISNAAYHKNVLLIYQQNAPVPDLTYCMVSEILGRHMSSLAWICWGESSNMVKERLVNFGCDTNSVAIIDTVSNFVDDECTIICAPTNYSSIMRNAHKLIKKGECILVLDHHGKTGVQICDTAYIKFQSVLLKNKNPDLTIIASIKSSLIDVNVQKSLSSQYDVVLYINKNTIKFKDQIEKKQISYRIKDNKLILEPSLISNISKIKEIFDISPEETVTLDKIVKKQIDANKRLLM